MRDIERLSRVERVKAFVSYYAMRAMGWRLIETAPKDGTDIIVFVSNDHDETRASIMEARWYTPYFNQDIDPPKPYPHWWGLAWRTGYSNWDMAEGPYGKPDQMAISPQWWKPRPRPSRRVSIIAYWASWIIFDREERKEME